MGTSCLIQVPEPVRVRYPPCVTVHLVWGGRNVGGPLAWHTAPLPPLLPALQVELPSERPRHLEGQHLAPCQGTFSLSVPEPVWHRYPPCVAVHLVWAGRDFGGPLAWTIAPLPPLPLALQVELPDERPRHLEGQPVFRQSSSLPLPRCPPTAGLIDCGRRGA